MAFTGLRALTSGRQPWRGLSPSPLVGEGGGEGKPKQVTVELPAEVRKGSSCYRWH